MTACDLETPALAGNWEEAMFADADPIARFCETFLAHNRNPEIERDYFAAQAAMDEYQPQTSRDVLRKFVAMYDHDGHPTEVREKALIAEAKRALRNEAANAAPNQTIGRIFNVARMIQSKARQVEQLAATCEEALAELLDGGPGYAEARKAAGERLGVFLDLARSVAEEIEVAGEKIEVAEADFITTAGRH